MSNPQIEIQLIAALVAMACAIPGVFLVLRKMSMIADAISHAILPGIVIGFFITHDISSILLILMAATSGVLTVIVVEFIQKTGLVKEDTAIGLVFPALFSLGIILITQNANDVHLDVDSVLLGELAFAPFDRLIISDIDLGPKAIWVIGSIFICNCILVITFFKELKISTFDISLSASLGFSPVLLHYSLMSMSSITTVGAFDAVGAVLVIAFMIAPAATAYLITQDLKKMLILSMGLGACCAITGYWFAHVLDASIAGAITTVLGIMFFLVYVFAKNTGIFSVLYRRKQQRIEVMLLTFLLHLNNHKDEESERLVKHLDEHINWHKVKAASVLDLALKNNMITITNDLISLTEKGESFTQKAIDFIIENKDSEIENMKNQFFLFRG